MHKKLTLIICTYQRAKEVETLLASISKQTLIPDEILIIDASNDNRTRSIVDRDQALKDVVDLKYYSCPESRGLTKQRNYGIERAKGEIVAFLDDDVTLQFDYFEQILECFSRNPEACGIGGYIETKGVWNKKEKKENNKDKNLYWHGNWYRLEDTRWKLRKMFNLQNTVSPGYMPSFGHGRPLSWLPPDDQDYQVEFLMGGASAWKRTTLQKYKFSNFFIGYGLYEDFDFCTDVIKEGTLYLCTKAKLLHYTSPTSRPSSFSYGYMVVWNGWYVWRRREKNPSMNNKFKWWSITLLLTACRFLGVFQYSYKASILGESFGRLFAMIKIFFKKPIKNV